jgi:hypothetical protein
MLNVQNTQLSIGHNTMGLSIDDAVSAYADISDGYIFTIDEFTCSASNFKNFINDITHLFSDLTKYDYSLSRNSVFFKLKSKDFRMNVRGNSSTLRITVYAKSDDVLSVIWHSYLKYDTSEPDIEIFSYSFSMRGDSICDYLTIIKKSDLGFLSEKFYPYIDIDVMLQQFFTGHENILLLVGEPGLGKSKFSSMIIKYAINNPDLIPYDKTINDFDIENQFINIAFAKGNEVLCDDTFWRTLEEKETDFCIIDDLDYMLTSRGSEIMSNDDAIKNAFLNQFLSYTDGVKKNKTKFIITTNQRYDDIDTALLRKGRLFDILELRKLHRHEALEIWEENKLPVHEFEMLFSNDSVLPADLGSEINKRLNTRIAVSTQPYLKEKNISKVNAATRRKKITV